MYRLNASSDPNTAFVQGAAVGAAVGIVAAAVFIQTGLGGYLWKGLLNLTTDSTPPPGYAPPNLPPGALPMYFAPSGAAPGAAVGTAQLPPGTAVLFVGLPYEGGLQRGDTGEVLPPIPGGNPKTIPVRWKRLALVSAVLPESLALGDPNAR